MRIKKKLQEIMTAIFPNLMETINPQILAAHQPPSTRNKKKTALNISQTCLKPVMQEKKKTKISQRKKDTLLIEKEA